MWIFMMIIYLMMMIFGSFVVLSSSSWMFVWVGLEVNMISFIGFVGVSEKLSSESLIKYFVVQVFGSLIVFFFGILINFGFFYYIGNLSMIYFLVLVLSMKLGVSPFHYWFPVVVCGLGWLGVSFLLTWQSFSVLGLMMVLGGDLIFYVGFVSIVVGSVLGYNQLMLRSILSYSSISHVGWMMILIGYSDFLVFFYYLFYVFLSLVFLLSLVSVSYSYLGQVSSLGFGMYSILVMIFFMMLSLGGMPPFLGFIPKWVGLMSVFLIGKEFFMMLVLFFGLLSLYYYLRLGYSTLLMSVGFNFWQGFIMSGSFFYWFFFFFSFFSFPVFVLLML